MTDPLKRAAWAALSLLAAILLASFYAHPIGWSAGLFLAGLTVLSAFRPYDGLLVVAALSPISSMFSVVLRIDAGGLRLIEGITLAFLTGWAAHRVAAPVPVSVGTALRWSSTALILASLAAAVVSGATVATEHGGSTAQWLSQDFFESYAVHMGPAMVAVLFAESVLLLLAAADVCAGDTRRRDGVIRMMVVGAAAAAAFNVLRIAIDGALSRAEPWREFIDLLLNLRVNVHHTDLNAAGSYFAMMLFLALGLLGRSRVLASISLLLISAGLWTVGSRVAMAAVVILGGVLLADRLVRRQKQRVGGIALLLLIAAASIIVFVQLPLRRSAADPSVALQIRLSLAAGAIDMALDHPVFGARPGRFYELSDDYIRVPGYSRQENAHNNYLQILAELGIPGLCLFLAVVWTGLAAARHSIEKPPWALVAGLSAFLLTCAGGHPLLVPHAAFPFWTALGLAGSSSLHPGRHRAIQYLGMVLAAFFVVSLPWRAHAAIGSANLEHTSVGFSPAWQHSAEGVRYRWAGGRSTFYVPEWARAVTIPLKLGNEAPGPLEVHVLLEGRTADRFLLQADDTWHNSRLLLISRASSPFSRIDLEARIPDSSAAVDATPTNTGGLLMVGRPIIER